MNGGEKGPAAMAAAASTTPDSSGGMGVEGGRADGGTGLRWPGRGTGAGVDGVGAWRRRRRRRRLAREKAPRVGIGGKKGHVHHRTLSGAAAPVQSRSDLHRLFLASRFVTVNKKLVKPS